MQCDVGVLTAGLEETGSSLASPRAWPCSTHTVALAPACFSVSRARIRQGTAGRCALVFPECGIITWDNGQGAGEAHGGWPLREVERHRKKD